MPREIRPDRVLHPYLTHLIFGRIVDGPEYKLTAVRVMKAHARN